MKDFFYFSSLSIFTLLVCVILATLITDFNSSRVPTKKEIATHKIIEEIDLQNSHSKHYNLGSNRKGNNVIFFGRSIQVVNDTSLDIYINDSISGYEQGFMTNSYLILVSQSVRA